MKVYTVIDMREGGKQFGRAYLRPAPAKALATSCTRDRAAQAFRKMHFTSDGEESYERAKVAKCTYKDRDYYRVVELVADVVAGELVAVASYV